MILYLFYLLYNILFYYVILLSGDLQLVNQWIRSKVTYELSLFDYLKYMTNVEKWFKLIELLTQIVDTYVIVLTLKKSAV